MDSKYWEGLLQIIKSRVEVLNSIIGHALTKGEENEKVVYDFITSFLPKKYAISSGQLIDSHGSLSRQCDLIIFDKENHSDILLNERMKVIPLDICYATMEVKTSYDTKFLKEGLENITETRKNTQPLNEEFIVNEFNSNTKALEIKKYKPSKPVSILLFLTNKDSDNAATIREYIFEEYERIAKENRNNWDILPDLLFSLEHGLAVRFKDIAKHSKESLEFILFALQIKDRGGKLITDENGDAKSVTLEDGLRAEFLVDFSDYGGIFRTDVNQEFVSNNKAVFFSEKHKTTGESKKLKEPTIYKVVKFKKNETRIIDEGRAFIAFMASVEMLLNIKKIVPYSITKYYLEENFGKGELI